MDWRDEQIKLLNQIIEEQRVIIAELRAIIAERDATIVKLTERIAELERRLGLNSDNSGKPPSSDGLKKPARVQSLREKSGKKSGGQLGHKGSTLKQVENPDSIEYHKATSCPHCKTDLTNIPVIDTCKKQVFDIPENIKPIVTEHQFEIKRCPGCCKKVMIKGDGLAKAPVQYGPHVKAAVSYLHIHNLTPEKRVSEIINDLFGIAISVATVERIAKACAMNIEQVVEQIWEQFKTAPVKGADETSIRIGGKTRWVHASSSNDSVHYRATEKRGDIPKYETGVVVHDHFTSYDAKLENVQHAFCNAHHLRELKAVTEIDKEPWARSMARLLSFANLFAQQKTQDITGQWLTKFKKLYHKIISDGLYFHENLGALKKPNRGRIKRRPGHNLLLRLKKRDDDVLRFLSNPEVPFTNNQAEQALRMIKVKQKVSGCFRTAEGAKDFFTVRSYTATAQKRGVKPFDALARAFKGDPFQFVQN